MQSVNDVKLLPNKHRVRWGPMMLGGELWVIWGMPKNWHQSSATDQEQGKTKQNIPKQDIRRFLGAQKAKEESCRSEGWGLLIPHNPSCYISSSSLATCHTWAQRILAREMNNRRNTQNIITVLWKSSFPSYHGTAVLLTAGRIAGIIRFRRAFSL